MYGKVFAQMYQGSMVGAGPVVFALWPYCIANSDPKGFIEINSMLVAFQIGCTPEEIEKALDYLMTPDPHSRSKLEEGRRLVREGQFLFRIVNYAHYRAILDEEARREYQREWDRTHRPSGHARAKAADDPDAVRHGPTQSDKSDTGRGRGRGNTPSERGNGQKAVAVFSSAWKGEYGVFPSQTVLKRASRDMADLFTEHGEAVYAAAVSAFLASRDTFIRKNRHDPKFFTQHFDKFSVAVGP